MTLYTAPDLQEMHQHNWQSEALEHRFLFEPLAGEPSWKYLRVKI